MRKESITHWADEKEVIKSNKPLKLLLTLFKFLPAWIVRALIYPISFFYLIFSARAREESKTYQKQLKLYTDGETPHKVSPYRQIVSFALCLVEKMQGWLGQISFDELEYHDDDEKQLREELKKGNGAIIITSHLGNMELMRSLSDDNSNKSNREVPVVAIAEVNSSEQFTKTLKEINPKYSLNIVDSASIGPDTICYLMEQIESGALVVIAGDRTSAHARDKIIKQEFLGKTAPFPYGTFLIPFLIKSPVYYMFGLRSKTTIFNCKYNIHIEKSKIDFKCGRTEREENVKACCKEFAGILEKYCKMYPYQWYNFHNFWNI